MTTRSTYLRRRERAAALWRAVPPERFDIESYEDVCGSTACALGWLAHERHNGWRWRAVRGCAVRLPFRNARGLSAGTPFDHAQAYFGLSDGDAIECFTDWRLPNGDKPTSADVGARLLSLPITAP